MRLARFVGAGVLGYLIGTFPTADLVARRASGGTVDLRRAGTGNPGGANALKVLGKKAGVAVMVGDVAKGAGAGALGGLVAGPAGAHLAGTSAVVGHCFPVWTGFRGGKGVAAGYGQCLATFPVYFPVDLAVAGLTAANPLWKQRAYTATIVSNVAWVAAGLLAWRRGWRNLWGPRPSAGLPLAALVSSAVITYRFMAAPSGMVDAVARESEAAAA
jgi:glycerol-3-phosphate acyltransferase PlsY